eukprot:UN20777
MRNKKKDEKLKQVSKELEDVSARRDELESQLFKKMDLDEDVGYNDEQYKNNSAVQKHLVSDSSTPGNIGKEGTLQSGQTGT